MVNGAVCILLRVLSSVHAADHVVRCSKNAGLNLPLLFWNQQFLSAVV